jgi:hypothetical protein
MRRTAAVLAGGVLSPLLLCAADEQPPEGYLEIISQGYSRFEIEDGSVIASYPEAVDFTYLGYRVHADSLKFNQATMIAEALGNIELVSEEAHLRCSSITLDGNAGRITANGGLEGDSQKLGLGFRAREAELRFPPGEYNPELTELVIAISGGIAIADVQGNRLQADSASIRGDRMELSLPGPVRAQLQLERELASTEWLAEAGQVLEIECLRLQGVLTEELGLQSMLANDLRAVSESLTFAAPVAMLELLTVPPGAEPQWHFRADSAPVTVRAVGQDRVLSASSQAADMRFDAGGLLQGELLGGVKIWSGDSLLEGEEFVITPSDGGYLAQARGGLTVSGDIAAISGMSPVNLQEQLRRGTSN